MFGVVGLEHRAPRFDHNPKGCLVEAPERLWVLSAEEHPTDAEYLRPPRSVG